MKKIIIDTDPGIDDAIALVLAIKNSDKFDIKLITTVFGNVDIEKTTNNALHLTNFMNCNIPVSKGASQPLLLKTELDGAEIHGESGMDGYTFTAHNKKILNTNAVESIKNILQNTDDKITIITLGAMTNIASFLLAYPEYHSKIEEIVIMGGSLSGGNTNTVAEFNVYADPHACKVIFNTNIKITVFGLDVTRKACISSNNLEKLKTGNKLSNMCYNILRHYRSEGMKNGLMMHDATTICYLLKPELYDFEYKYIDVVLDGVGRGSFVSDYYTIRNNDKVKNIKYAVKIKSNDFDEFITNELLR